MNRFFRLAVGALIALSLAAGIVVGCSDDDQSQQQAEQQQAQPQQQDEQRAAPQSSAQAQQQQQAQQAQPVEPGEPLKVVVSTQIIADWVRQIGGDHVEVTSLVPAGADVHTIELSVADIRAVADADVVIINGAGLEASYEDAILENADHILNLAEALEDAGYELAPFEGMGMHEDEHGHDTRTKTSTAMRTKMSTATRMKTSTRTKITSNTNSTSKTSTATNTKPRPAAAC